MENKIKENGVVYTPDYIVKIILEQSGYNDQKILKKHAIDNSCGDGKFLVEMVKNYIEFFIKKNGIDLILKEQLKEELETYIHGIELDENEVLKCIKNLDDVVLEYGLEDVKWDVKQGNSLNITEYNGKMDYVLGNPPYVRVHNLKENFEYIKKQKFTNGGMTDLFIVFYEIGLEMLSESGILGYITPSSIFNSLAGEDFRKYVINNKLLTSVIDLKHYQAFEKFTTYTTILVLDKKNNRDIVEYFNFDEENKTKKFVEFLKYDDFNINSNWYFGKKNDLNSLKEILNVDIKTKEIEIKNGFATLADRVFIKEKFDFESKYIYPILKGSRKKWYKVFFPYNEEGKIIDFDEFEEELKNYLLKNKARLSERSLDKGAKWYSFGRSQGVNDFWKNKISINSLLKTKNDVKLEKVESGQGIYSGLYLTGNIGYNKIKSYLINEEFVNYIALLGKYKSGGYYTYSSADLKKYIVYKMKGDGE